MIVDNPLDLIFSNVFIRLHGIARRAPVVLKLEGFSITGSIKIKTAIYMIDALEAEGTARPGETTLVESSSGNLGIALSLVCKLRGYRFLCVTDPNAPNASLRAMRAYGAEVVIVDERGAKGGYLHTRLAYIRRLLADDPSCVWLNQYANKANQAAHYEMTAREILAAVPAPDFLFVGCGSSGTLMGCVQRFREESPSTRIIAVDPVGSVIFGGPPETATDSRHWRKPQSRVTSGGPGGLRRLRLRARHHPHVPRDCTSPWADCGRLDRLRAGGGSPNGRRNHAGHVSGCGVSGSRR